jgi:transposase
VEVAVQVAERWILARLRHQSFFSLAELNERIAELCEELNRRVMRRYGKSRRELFETLDRPALRPLPAERFSYADWKRVRVSIDYHVAIDRHYYSAPFQLIHSVLDARITATTVELLHKGERVAAHPRSNRPGAFSTDPAHMPKSHQKHRDWSPARLIGWAKTVGPQTAALVEAILADRPHPEQGYRSCLGLLRLAKHYGAERMELACARALSARARSYKHVEAILRNGLDRLAPSAKPTTASAPVLHENVRGSRYYH